MFRKSYEVVGFVGDAELLCPDCAEAAGFTGPEEQPVFLGDCQPDDYCAACLNQWIHDNPGRGPVPTWVYLDGTGPENAGEG